METKPLKITVVTVCYNSARFLEGCLRSVVTQGYPHLEYIVIDGGSTDGSAELIKKYADRIAYWVSEPDKGQTDALIKGFQRSTGDIQCWINADDELMPHALSEVASYFQRHPDVDVITGDCILLTETGARLRVQRQLRFHRFLWFNDHNYIAASSTFWRRELYERVGGLNPVFNLNMDGDLFIRFAEVTTLQKVRNLWSCFRVHPGQKTNMLTEDMFIEIMNIRRRYYPNEPALARKVKRLVARPLRMVLKLFAGCYFP
jgi:glycosyltransferase involved in cell wall biosynthesis